MKKKKNLEDVKFKSKKKKYYFLEKNCFWECLRFFFQKGRPFDVKMFFSFFKNLKKNTKNDIHGTIQTETETNL